MVNQMNMTSVFYYHDEVRKSTQKWLVVVDLSQILLSKTDQLTKLYSLLQKNMQKQNIIIKVVLIIIILHHSGDTQYHDLSPAILSQINT